MDRVFWDPVDHRSRVRCRVADAACLGSRAGVRGVSPIISWLVFQVVVLVLSLSEEIGIRGYLLPKLLPMGRKRALLVSGLVWATWHMPLIFLTSFLPVGNKLIAIPLFYATIIAASFYFGYLRIYSGSVWPPTIAHAVHNVAWGPMSMLTVTAYPVLVNYYLVGDFGILIAIGAAVAAVLVGRLVHPSTDEAQPGGHQALRSTTSTASADAHGLNVRNGGAR